MASASESSPLLDGGGSDKGSLARSVEYWCAISAPIGVVVFTVGYIPVGGIIPVWDPNSSAEEIAAHYRNNTTRVRFGLLLALLGNGVFGPLVVAISRRLRRMQPRQPAMEQLQIMSGTVAWGMLMIPVLMMSAVAYRPERSPEITQTVHDVAWFILIMGLTPFIVQYITICVCIFNDKSHPLIFPRWIGYLNLWLALLVLPTGLVTFFHTGPFTYGGLIGFYIPLLVFFIWFLAIPWAICRDIKREEHEIATPSY